jgi:predicted ABC-type ATPase
MVIVAGPPGSGKTTRFPLAEFGVDSFNADYRAAQPNAGSFRGISKEIRSQVNVEFQKWILDHISARKSFALETTLRDYRCIFTARPMSSTCRSTLLTSDVHP